jgi:hypothetical protein
MADRLLNAGDLCRYLGVDEDNLLTVLRERDLRPVRLASDIYAFSWREAQELISRVKDERDLS